VWEKRTIFSSVPGFSGIEQVELPRDIDVQTVDMTKYLEAMREIKLRQEVIHNLSTGALFTKYNVQTIEVIGLQFRKIFELIALASLSAHHKLYSQAYKDFASHWRASKMIGNLRKINPNFYPHPIIQGPSDDPKIASKWSNRKDDYLTEARLIDAHWRCGALMHAANPYAKTIDYDSYAQNFKIWHEQFVNLLDCHTIQFPNDKVLYLIQMGAGKGNPTITLFARLDGKNQISFVPASGA
jgi:hypothetical protein